LTVVVAHTNTSLTYANLIEALIDSNIKKTQNKTNIVSMPHKFNKLTLATSIEPQSTTIWTINVLHYFPIDFKSVNILIHLIFTFQRTFKPFISKKLINLWNSKFGGAKEVFVKQLKIFQFGNHHHEI